jgi:hypothetical protein
MINSINYRQTKYYYKYLSYRLFIEPAKINDVINTNSFSLVKPYMVLRYARDIIFANLIGSGIEP